MNLHPLDLAIIAAYIVATVGIGFWISRKASKSLQNYFLGGNEIPWYALGLSNASGMFDISGTMWLVYLLFVYGMKSVWVPWLWPVFNQIFLMVYLSVWLRRSGVMTGAEWIRFRFGDTRGAKLSHLVVVLFALINVVGFLAYGFIGIGQFAAAFLPFELAADPTTPGIQLVMYIRGLARRVFIDFGDIFRLKTIDFWTDSLQNHENIGYFDWTQLCNHLPDANVLTQVFYQFREINTVG